MTAIFPTDIKAITPESCLQISWNDHPTWKFSFRYLRESCGCARCVHEITGEKLLDPASIPDDIHVKDMSLVGNYAVKFVWSDGHDTGLYTWTALLELCRCEECVSLQ